MTAVVVRDVAAEFAQIIGKEFSRRPPRAVAGGTDPGLVGVWLTHRICAPEHAAAVYRLCLRDRRVLPRWHQDDRGERNAVRGFHVEAPAGAYRGVRAWSGRLHWLQVVVPVAIAHGLDVLKRHHVAPDMFARWARVKSGYADARSGRRCIVRTDTVASVMGVAESTVHRCQRAARELGLEHIALAGRMLNYDERGRAQRWGSRQRGLANEVGLTIPDELHQEVRSRTAELAGSVDHDTPSRGLQKSSKPHPIRNSLHGLRPNQKDAAPRRRLQKGPEWWAACRLASEVALRLPWLAGEGRRRLAPALMRFAVAETPWAAAELVGVIGRLTARRGGIHPDMIRTRPAILLAGILRRIDPIADHPSLEGPLVGSGRLISCGGPDCDGHGWINGVDQDGHAWARPCPDCLPAVRGSAAGGSEDPWAPPLEPGEHPF